MIPKAAEGCRSPRRFAQFDGREIFYGYRTFGTAPGFLCSAFDLRASFKQFAAWHWIRRHRHLTLNSQPVKTSDSKVSETLLTILISMECIPDGKDKTASYVPNQAESFSSERNTSWPGIREIRVTGWLDLKFRNSGFFRISAFGLRICPRFARFSFIWRVFAGTLRPWRPSWCQ